VLANDVLGTLVLSSSFVQDQVADSSCECEYYAYSAGVNDMEYVRLLIRDLSAIGIDLPVIPTLLVDCAPAIAVATVPQPGLGRNILISKSGCVVTMSVGK
jgi:hypothetical protein